MGDFINDNVKHLLCALILLGRLGDIGSTFLVTPTLKLEANLLVRRLGWRFALLSLLLCLVPYVHAHAAALVLVPSLMVSASNIGKAWIMRTYGEAQYAELLVQVARRSKLSHALLALFGSCFFVALTGVVLALLSSAGGERWGCWFGMGLVVYASAIALHGSLWFRRLFRTARLQATP